MTGFLITFSLLFSDLSSLARYEVVVDSLQTELKQTSDEEEQVRLYKEIIYELSLNDWDRQGAVLEEAESLLRKNPEVYYDLLYEHAWSGTFFGKFEYADSVYQVLLEVFKDKPASLAGLYANMGFAKYDNLRLKEADSLAVLSSSFHKENEEDPLLMNLKSMIYIRQGRLGEAFQNIQKQVNYADSTAQAQTESKIVAYANLGEAYMEQGNWGEGLRAHRRCFDLAKEARELEIFYIEQYLFLLELYARVHLEGLNEQKLLSEVRDLIEKYGAENLRVNLDMLLLTKAIQNRETKKCNTLIQSLTRQIELTNNKILIPELYSLQIEFLWQEGSFERCQVITDKLYALSRQEGMQQYEALCLLYYAKLAGDQNFDRSQIFLREALQISRDNKITGIEAEVYQALSEAYQSAGKKEDYQQAFTQYLILKDSLALKNEDIGVLTAYFQDVHDYLNIHSAEFRLQAAGDKDKGWLGKSFILSALVLLLLLIGGGYFYTQRKSVTEFELKKTEEAATRRKREEEIKYLESIKTQLAEKNLDWGQFQIEYEALFPEFFQQCRAMNIKLTNNTVRNLIFIRMNLSAKEAADLYGVGEEAIRKARYRISKQLDLPSTESLVSFINKL